jgi:hypothetical protein
MSQTIQTQATNLLSGIPFGNLIGAPMIAAVDAQGMAAMETVKFVEAVGFTTTTTGNPPVTTTVPQTITFSYTKSVPATAPGAMPTNQTFTLTVPQLVVTPIPFLRITTMTIAFTASIQADTSTTVTNASNTSFSASLQASASFSFLTAKLNASISNTSSTNSTANSAYNVQYTMAINVTAAEADMPAGLQAILNILTNSITPVSAA